jgi:transporter family-2 protein
MHNTLFYIILMLVAGLGIPTMAALNAGLGAKLNSPILAVTILLCVGLMIAATLLLISEGVPKTLYVTGTPWHLYCGGALFVFYILSVTWGIPKFGVANAIGLVLFGQLIAMCTIDHFGLFGALKYEMDFKRLCGLILMGAGIFLVVSKTNTN